MVQEESEGRSITKKKFNVRDVTSIDRVTLSHDIVRNMVSDKWKWLKVFRESAQVLVTFVTNGSDGWDDTTNLHTHLTQLHMQVIVLKTSLTKFLTHLSHSSFYIDITYFYVFFTNSHISQLLQNLHKCLSPKIFMA